MAKINKNVTNPTAEEPINNKNVMTNATITSVIAKLQEALAELEPFIPNITPEEIKHSVNVTEKSIRIVEEAINFAEQNPKTVSPVMNVAEWKAEIEGIIDLTPLKAIVKQITTEINKYELRLEIDAMNNFVSYYRTIKVLIQEGYTPAVPIYDELKKMYSKYFGPRPKKEKTTSTAEEKIVISGKNGSKTENLEGKTLLILNEREKK